MFFFKTWISYRAFALRGHPQVLDLDVLPEDPWAGEAGAAELADVVQRVLGLVHHQTLLSQMNLNKSTLICKFMK